jgi:isoquinoline 1-oxidoreductase subunit beta
VSAVLKDGQQGPALGRRHFLKTAGLAAGGLWVSIALPARAQKAGAPPLQNAWVHVGSDDKVTLICHRNEMGQDVHTSLSMLLAEELGVNLEQVAIVQAPVDPVYINKMLGGQITGGSTSVRDAWQPLRQAGAAARMQLLQAAADHWKVSVDSLRAEQGAVIDGRGRRLRYGALADAAGKLPPPEAPALKPVDSFKLIGNAAQKRLDTPAKVKGAARFGIDVILPGTLYASVLQCPVIGGKVTSVDDAKAKAMPGVRQIVNIGDGVAVVADHYWNAKKARDALNVSWDEGPGAKLDNAAVSAVLKSGLDKQGYVAKHAGDVDAGLAGAAQKLSADYEMPLLAHITLEPQNCVARVADGRCEVWVSTQFPQGSKGIAAARSGVDPAQVEIYPQFVGGGFGRRLEVDFVGQCAAIAAQVPGTPIKMIWTREDDVRNDFYRPASLHRMQAGLDQDGKLVALDGVMISDSITSRAFPGVVKDGNDGFMTEGLVNLTYDIPNLKLMTVIVSTGVRVGYWRSVSHALNAFAVECFIDELAAAAKQDPVAFRLAMLGAQPRQSAALRKAAEMSGWGKPLPAGQALGVASMECYGTHVALVARVTKQGDNYACDRLWFALDCGVAVHPAQVVAQIQSGAVTGLIGALRNSVTIEAGRVKQSNFHDFLPVRMSAAPAVEVHLIPSSESPGGIGEVGVPLVAPALANAVAVLSGKRMHSTPFSANGINFA